MTDARFHSYLMENAPWTAPRLYVPVMAEPCPVLPLVPKKLTAEELSDFAMWRDGRGAFADIRSRRMREFAREYDRVTDAIDEWNEKFERERERQWPSHWADLNVGRGVA